VYFATHHDDDGMPSILPKEMIGVVMERKVRKRDILFYTCDRLEDEVILKEFSKGPHSPEGMLWTSEWKGEEAFAAEFETQREFLKPDVIRLVQRRLSVMNSFR
jgi:hypothetical protein